MDTDIGAGSGSTPGKSRRGGKREGSGRKPLDSAADSLIVGFRASPALKQEITNRGGSEWLRSVVIRAIEFNW